MALIRWYDRDLEPPETYDWLQQQINDLFQFPRSVDTQGVFDRSFSPALDVVEHADRFTVECDLPGVDKKNLDISIAAGVLTIRGEKKLEGTAEKGKVYKKEIWEGSFQRTLSLPSGVDPDNIEATYRDGVLSISIPKREEARARRIELKSR